uniref:Syntrophin beta 2 n=1 Tax=Strigops habroptila TaxID=2489341 RepID=A0A672TFY8_STRHB
SLGVAATGQVGAGLSTRIGMAIWTHAWKAGLLELLLRERWVWVVAELSREVLSLMVEPRSSEAAVVNSVVNGNSEVAPGCMQRVRVVKAEAGGLIISIKGAGREVILEGPPLKFMWEVTPYTKKSSLVSDLPWEGAALQSPSLSDSKDSGSPQHQGPHDCKAIPLKVCFTTRNLSMPDLENRLIVLHSPDRHNTLILRCKDTEMAHSWFTALHTNIVALLPKVLAELNTMLSTGGAAAGSREVKHIAWLAEQACLDRGRQQWRPILIEVTEKDLLLYDGMPWTRDVWASPCHSYPLVATRLVHSGSGYCLSALGSELTFATWMGSHQGVEMHIFRVETHWDLSSWTHVLVQGCNTTGELIKEVTAGECSLLGRQEVQLCIHYEGSFTIHCKEPDGRVLVCYPYKRLKMSADDGIRTPYLDFGGPKGELVLDLHSCPKPIVFVLHAFILAKVTRMGLLA